MSVGVQEAELHQGPPPPRGGRGVRETQEVRAGRRTMSRTHSYEPDAEQ